MVSENSSPTAFVTTQWTRVLEARGNSPEAKAALSDLCAAYYAPVLAFIRRDVRDEDLARDLTQEFFARLLAKHGLNSVEQSKGRFRSYLLGAVNIFSPTHATAPTPPNVVPARRTNPLNREPTPRPVCNCPMKTR